MTKKKYFISLIFNGAIFVLVTFATISMLANFDFMVHTDALVSDKWQNFKYFTIDSNVLLGTMSLIIFIYELYNIRKNNLNLPYWCYLLKLIGTVGTTLTMLVTVFFLAPTFGSNFLMLFVNSNLIYHLIVPVLAVVSMLAFEKNNYLKIKDAVFGVIPMGIYAIYYSINCLTHIVDGKVSNVYDWYGFLFMGVKTFPIVIIVMLGVTFLFAFLLVKLSHSKENN